MISIRLIELMHNALIDEFGGSKGVRDLRGLEAAIARPFATFDQIDLYSNVVEKAAAIFESLIINHPFIDGNKRIAFALMATILEEGRMTLTVNEDELYSMVIAASTGEMRFDEIKSWIEQRVTNDTHR